MDAFIATILPVGFDFAPQGWMFCRGQILPINNYQAAFALVSTAYGGTGTTTFGLPNLQGRNPVGYGQATTGTFYKLGEDGGKESLALSLTNLPTHTHEATFTATLGNAPVTFPAVTGDQKVSVKLEAQAQAGLSQLPAANSHLAGGSSSSVKTYLSTGTNPVELAGVTASLSGQPSIPSMQTTVSTVTGGTVGIAQTGLGQAFSTFSPYLAVNFIFCMQGIFPSRQ